MTEFSEESMADLGRALMAAIETHVPGGWSPMDCPSEIVGDLVTELGELRADAERYRWLRDEDKWGDDADHRWKVLGEKSCKDFDALVDEWMGRVNEMNRTEQLIDARKQLAATTQERDELKLQFAQLRRPK